MLNRFKQLREAEEFNLSDDEAIEKMKDFFDNDIYDNTKEVIDLEAESEEDLTKPHVGDMILICPVCKAAVYKKLEDVVEDETSDFVNVEDSCAVCHSTGGFELIGKVAPAKEVVEEESKEIEKIEVEDEAKDEASEEEKEETNESLEEVKEERTDEDCEDEECKEECVDKTVDESITAKLQEKFDDVVSYKTLKVKKVNETLELSGKITFSDESTHNTKFIVEASKGEVLTCSNKEILDESVKLNEGWWINNESDPGDITLIYDKANGDSYILCPQTDSRVENFDELDLYGYTMEDGEELETWPKISDAMKKKFIAAWNKGRDELEAAEALEEGKLDNFNSVSKMLQKHMSELNDFQFKADINEVKAAVLDLLDKYADEVDDKKALEKFKNILKTNNSTSAIFKTIATYAVGKL